MVKADYSRDYYADLDLPQNADVNDIKKQFRKLALKYHPDRNPGREAEVNAKFQMIQSAHEILTSPEQRSKYDAQRARRAPGASNGRGNPWSDAGRNFPPPPQRNRPNAPNTSSRSTGTASSADRYARFPNPPPPPPRTNEDPKSRADAFESMRPKPKPRAPTAANSGARGNSDSFGTSTRTRAPDPRQTAYTASQQKKAEASFGNRTGRSSRSGFVPDSPAMGDEPPVTSNNYMSSRRHTSLFDETAGPPQVPPRERQNHHGAGADSDDGFPPNLDPRSSPYQKRSGERLNPMEGGAPINRAKSTKEDQRRADHDFDHLTTPNHRQRSFSVSDEPEGASHPAAEPRQANISRKTTSNAGKMPESSNGSRFGDHFAANTGLGMSGVSSTGHGFHGGSGPSATSGAATDGHDGSHRYRDGSDPYHKVFPQTPSNGQHGGTGDPNHFARSSADSINTRFVPDDHSNVDWQFSAGGDLGPGTNGAGARRAQAGSRPDRRSPTKSRSRTAAGIAAGAAAAAGMAATGAFGNAGSGSEGSGPDEGNDFRGPGQQQQPPPQTQQQQAAFDAGVWSDKIGSEHFVPVPPTRGPGSPSRPPARPPKRRPTIRMTKGGSAGLVDDEDSTSGEERVAGMDSSNAMDIDTPMGEPATAAQAAAANGVRGVPLEPSRPEWRAGDTNGFAAAAPTIVSPSAAVPPGIRPRFNVSNAAGSEDTDELRTGFDEFKNVEPIAQRPAGLQSFEDLKSHLPFESRASASIPVPAEKTKGGQKASIEFPKPPLPPRAPPTLAVSGLKPSKSAWEAHVNEFEIYLHEWDNFNSKFVDHVLARQNQLDKAKQKHGLSLLYTRNSSSTQEYAGWLEQDQQVHDKWTTYHSEHLRRVREFMGHQEKMAE